MKLTPIPIRWVQIIQVTTSHDSQKAAKPSSEFPVFGTRMACNRSKPLICIHLYMTSITWTRAIGRKCSSGMQ